MTEDDEKQSIPFQDQALRLFNLLGEKVGDADKQKIIPFLGAGVSISERVFSSPSVTPNAYPDKKTVAEILQHIGLPGQPEFKLSGQARVFMEMALQVAYHLQAVQDDLKKEIEADLLSQLSDSEPYPPSAGELAQLFSDLAKYSGFKPIVRRAREMLSHGYLSATEEEQIEMFKYLTKAAGIANPPDPLTSIASYYLKGSDRSNLWDVLKSLISGKIIPTRTHRLLARAAKFHFERKLKQDQSRQDYLIITTNYDSLMEQALEEMEVPYAVLITENTEHRVIVKFSSRMPAAKDLERKYSHQKLPKDFALEETEKMVLLLKLHGGLNEELKPNEDGVVISDDDYVAYVSQMNTSDGVIPADLIPKMQNKPFLFLGYSLNDWNVRSIFETFKKKRNERLQTRDFAVMRSVRDFERIFFDKNNVQIYKTDLAAYIDGLLPYVPEHLRGGLET